MMAFLNSLQKFKPIGDSTNKLVNQSNLFGSGNVNQQGRSSAPQIRPQMPVVQPVPVVQQVPVNTLPVVRPIVMNPTPVRPVATNYGQFFNPNFLNKFNQSAMIQELLKKARMI